MGRKVILVALTSATLLVPQTQPELEAARAGLSEFQRVCREAGDRLWGVSLCGRVLLVDPGNRVTVASMPDPDQKFQESGGLYVGKLPADLLLANTSIQWGGHQWAMVLLPLPADEFLRLRLLAHESFHRAQPELGLRASDAASAHLEAESGRLWLRLELRALAQALRLKDSAARSAAKDAMLFRAARQQLNPGADIRESALEIQEGLAEYTGTVIALEKSGETLARVARGVEDFEDRPAFSRSFAYATGPALGLLLDRYSSGWRKKLKQNANLGALLGEALGFRASGADLVSRAEAAAEPYGFRAVAAKERTRALETQARLAAYRAQFVDGPVLEFPKTEELRRSFNPSNLVPLGDHGTVYPTGTFASRWGKLQIDDVGGLLAPDNQSLRVIAPPDPSLRPLPGPGWRLELAPGWTVRSGAKPGNFLVAQE